MRSVLDHFEIADLRKEVRELSKANLELEAKIRILDELADEILMLQSPESMREVALYLKEIIKQ